MTGLNPLLLESDALTLNDGGGNPLGSYNPMQFVLRLRKDIHEVLNAVTPGVQPFGTNSMEQNQAFSTYLHETIHWWQYMGSNFGFISSLRYPSQAHAVWADLQETVQTLDCFKSIEEYHQQQWEKTGKNNPKINRILNYWYDLEGAAMVSFDPESVKDFLESTFYASIGHSAYIQYFTAISCIASIIDKELHFLPKADKWGPAFQKLQREKVMWHDPEPESISMPAFGTKGIYEGQARMSQLQYLYFASNGQYHFEDFRAQGLLSGIYTVALDHFLDSLEEQLPAHPHHPLIGLFLLVCDVAINPTDGFPYDMDGASSFYVSTDPGWRFRVLCMLIREEYPFLKNVIVKYSKEEYADLSLLLSNAMRCRSPHESAGLVSSWAKDYPAVTELMKEEEQLNYQNANLPIRLFFSKYIRFNQDKYQYPQLFCWPGVHMVGLQTNEIDLSEVVKLFQKHSALFTDNLDGNVYATKQGDISEEQLDQTMNDFYAWNSVYDMVRQWIIQPGPFEYDLRWLTKKYSKETAKNWVCNNFKDVFGHHPDSFIIL